MTTDYSPFVQEALDALTPYAKLMPKKTLDLRCEFNVPRFAKIDSPVKDDCFNWFQSSHNFVVSSSREEERRKREKLVGLGTRKATNKILLNSHSSGSLFASKKITSEVTALYYTKQTVTKTLNRVKSAKQVGLGGSATSFKPVSKLKSPVLTQQTLALNTTRKDFKDLKPALSGKTSPKLLPPSPKDDRTTFLFSQQSTNQQISLVKVTRLGSSDKDTIKASRVLFPSGTVASKVSPKTGRKVVVYSPPPIPGKVRKVHRDNKENLKV